MNINLNRFTPGTIVAFTYLGDKVKGKGVRIAMIDSHKPEHKMTLVRDNHGNFKNMKWDKIRSLRILNETKWVSVG